ncbi:MAG: hypothetical protein US41_C0043G0005 [Parcubacteria group bacterium GW2011_GWB1_37_13]|nr:MAG: hypothetical protein US41_C0043G0005 [Parcubacteria group bacterium GW2011_GWB1_37_13]
MSTDEAKKIVEKYADIKSLSLDCIYLALSPKAKLENGAILMLPSFPRERRQMILSLNWGA